jgi:hypothetical protein
MEQKKPNKILDSVVGLSIIEAVSKLKIAGYRQVVVSGEIPQLLTSCICRDRVTLEVDAEGKVSSATVG